MGLKELINREISVVEKQDKIRPKWDWKQEDEQALPHRNSQIKSDQNGIERVFALIAEINDNRWIKSDQNGIESLEVVFGLPVYIG